MTTFSKANFKTLQYNSFRPHYPGSFYKILGQYTTKDDVSKLPLKKAIDLGCGTGVATYPLLNICEDVIGLDISPKMIETANSLIPQRTQEFGVDSHRISFKTCSTEDFLHDDQRQIHDNSVDLITAAQCIHWFQDFPKFFRNASELLKPQGTLAYFYYVDPFVVDFRGAHPRGESKIEILNKAKELYHDYVYNDETLIGPHWEQPGRTIIKNSLVDVNECIPQDLYEDITIKTFSPNFETGDVKPHEDDLCLEKTNILVDDYLNYLRTYSGYHAFRDATGDKDDVFKRFKDDLFAELGWDENTRIDLVWNTGYTFIRKK